MAGIFSMLLDIPDDDVAPKQLIRPGFGEDITTNKTSEDDYESFASYDWQSVTFTIRELYMLWFVEQITNKPEWNRKVFDETIVAKWKDELAKVDWEAAVGYKHGDFTDDLFDFTLRELQEKAKLYDETGVVPIFDASAAVLKSDTAIPDDLKEELRAAVADLLEDVPEDSKDWHPKSDEKVLDLVHPSLFPLIYGRSLIVPRGEVLLERCLDAGGIGEKIPVPDMKAARRSRQDFFWSKSFQWLPCEVELPKDSSEKTSPKIVSYINNLHPTKQGRLYPIIEKVIGKALPMWHVCCKWPFEAAHERRVNCESVGRDCLTTDICGEDAYECDQRSRPLEEDEDPRPDEDEYDEDDDTDPLVAKDKEWFDRTHPIFLPDLRDYEPLRLTKDSFNYENFADSKSNRIQVIVKLANIELTPENPTYDGGSWHIEGQRNEHIISSALYYYDSENITDSYLAFRTRSDREDLQMELSHAQGDYASIEGTFPIDCRGPAIVELGRTLTPEGRLLVFPNVYQHQVSRFELKDKTKPGHRKILALFLVDPDRPIISTANVPPQQQHWWLGDGGLDPRQGDQPKLPAELRGMVSKEMDWCIDLEEAKEIRLKLMAERTTMRSTINEHVEHELSWNFCEH